MSAVLMVIESPGKAAACRSALRRMGVDGEVFATGGRLFDLPEGRMGVAPETLRPEWAPVRPGVVERLRKAMLGSGEILLALDADDEGDMAAAHAAALAPNLVLRRVLLGAYDDATLDACLAAPVAMRPAAADRAVARRLLDRLLGYCPPGERFRRVGRVVTPLLASLRSMPLTPSAVCVRHADGWCAKMRPATFSERPGVLSMLRFSTRRHAAPKRSETAPPPQPLDGWSALHGVSERLGISVQGAAALLQTMYEAGRMTYPRSDDPAFTSGAVQRMADQAKRIGLPVEGMDMRGETASGHGALAPLPSADQGDRLLRRGGGEQGEVMRLLFSHLYWHRMGASTEVLRCNGRDGIAWVRLRLLDREGREPDQGDADLPMTPPCSVPNEPPAHALGRAVLSRMAQLGLGRTSTAPAHVSRVLSLLDGEGRVNAAGMLSLQRAQEWSPALLEAQRAPQADVALREAVGVRDKVLGALEALGCAAACEKTLSLGPRRRLDPGVGVQRLR